MDLIDIFRTFHPNAEYTFFLSAHRPHLGSQIKCRWFKKIEIVSSIFSDHNAMRLDINYKKKTVRNTNTWRLNNTFLNNKRVTEELKGNQKISGNKWQWKHDNSKPMVCSKSSSKRKFIVRQSYLKKWEKHQIDNLTLHLKQLEKEEKKISIGKDIIKICVEINEKKCKKQ